MNERTVYAIGTNVVSAIIVNRTRRTFSKLHSRCFRGLVSPPVVPVVCSKFVFPARFVFGRFPGVLRAPVNRVRSYDPHSLYRTPIGCRRIKRWPVNAVSKFVAVGCFVATFRRPLIRNESRCSSARIPYPRRRTPPLNRIGFLVTEPLRSNRTPREN